MFLTSTSANTSELHVFQDKALDFCAIICLQHYGRGPALGGCRMMSYPSIAVAIEEATRLAKAMSYKAALSELPHDGGKAIIMRSHQPHHHHAVLQRFAECVHSLNGRYITTIDSGTSQADMSIIKDKTAFVTGYLEEGCVVNNPSVFTALGVFKGMEAAVKLTTGQDQLVGLHVAIQGVGNVGYHLAKLLHQAGARLTICDIDPNRAMQCAAECHATVVSPSAIYAVPCDIFSPCALGQILNAQTVPQLRTNIIAGAANDQLSSPVFADRLTQRNILYIPDYLINAGGLIQLSLQRDNKDQAAITDAVIHIGQRILYLAEKASLQKKTLFAAAEDAAEAGLTGKQCTMVS